MSGTWVPPDWVADTFPGDGSEYPGDEERNRADGLIRRFNALWAEQHPPVPRTHPDVSDEGYASYNLGFRNSHGALAGEPTNRAYLRSTLRRWWWGGKRGRPVT